VRGDQQKTEPDVHTNDIHVLNDALNTGFHILFRSGAGAAFYGQPRPSRPAARYRKVRRKIKKRRRKEKIANDTSRGSNNGLVPELFFLCLTQTHTHINCYIYTYYIKGVHIINPKAQEFDALQSHHQHIFQKALKDMILFLDWWENSALLYM